MAKYRMNDPVRPVVVYGVKDLYIKHVGKITKENTLAIVQQETDKAYLMRNSYNYPNVRKEEAGFSTDNEWVPKSKITNIKTVGFKNYNIKKIEWRNI